MEGSWPAKLYLVNRRGRPNRLDEETVSELDISELGSVDLTINPSNWEVNGKTGVKAYLKDLYASLVEDEFFDKYNNPYNNDRIVEANDYYVPRR